MPRAECASTRKLFPSARWLAEAEHMREVDCGQPTDGTLNVTRLPSCVLKLHAQRGRGLQ